jgi:2-polyprenyl-3-methyl-5-hydroxy-6-metoxy-1,4-benzoquinol methylase
MLDLNLSLTPQETDEMSRIPAANWFTQAKFANGISPRSPEVTFLDENHEMKKRLMLPWIRENVPGKRVLDLFSANGAFAIESAMAGAKEVVGLEFDPDRVRCAEFLARVLGRNGITAPTFRVGDVYTLTERFSEPFDIVLCMGGLYHIADPPYVLTQVRKLIKEKLIIQTSNVLPGRSNRASFLVRRDRTASGLSSIRGGKGVWRCSVSCFQAILQHAGLRVLEDKQPNLWQRRRFPWYCAVAVPKVQEDDYTRKLLGSHLY